MSTRDERTSLAQALVSHRDAVDLEDVVENWDDWGPERTRAMYDAGEFIALHDALMKARATPTPEPMSADREADLDLVERTPHAMRGEKWLRAAQRLDAAGIPYIPGARYNS